MMKQEIPREVLTAFTNNEPDLTGQDTGEFSIERISGGLINHSYKISSRFKRPFLLQQINKHVFARPELVQENYIHVWQYAEFEFTGLRLPAPVYCGRMTTLFVDAQENYWRAFEYIGDSHMLTVAERPAQAKATAKAFAKFTAAFDEFNVSLLHEVIPGFHDLALRYGQLETAMKGENYERMAIALPVIKTLQQRESYKHFL